MSSPEELYGNQFGQEAYYKSGGLEAVDVIEAFAPGNVHRSHALKYLLRAGKKGPAKQDLEKALWWVRREIARLEQNTVPTGCADDCTHPSHRHHEVR